jgi:hypothetical protein
VQVARARLHIKQAGRGFALGLQHLHQVHRRQPVGRVVVGAQLAQAQGAAVGLRQVDAVAGRG